jgi:hypothetical protein
MDAFLQGSQLSLPSHLTLRFRQQSHARRSAGLTVGGETASSLVWSWDCDGISFAMLGIIQQVDARVSRLAQARLLG